MRMTSWSISAWAGRCAPRSAGTGTSSRCASFEILLLGHVQLGLPGRSFDLPYSSVSDDLMSRLVDIIRQRYARADAHVSPVTPIEVREGELSFLFDGLLARERRAGTGMRLVAAQGTVGVGAPGMTVARRLAARMAAMRLLESIHLTDGRELIDHRPRPPLRHVVAG